MTFRRASLFAVLLLFGALVRAETVSTAPPAVVIERLPPDVQQRTFDPKNPPATMPSLRPGEAAVTESNASCQTVVSATIIDQIPSANGCTSTVRITGVKTTIKLGIVIWLP